MDPEDDPVEVEGKDRAPPKPIRKDTSPSSDRTTGARARPIGELAGRLLARPLGKRGFAAVALAADWPAIVGPTLAAATLPLRVSFPAGTRTQGTLHLRVASGAFALQLQHLGPLIVERINGHFGYAAVARLALAQGPVPARAARRRQTPAAAPAVDPVLAKMIAAVDDPGLRDALTGLGRRLAGGWQRP
jgi:hypothetical protein